MNSKLKSLKKRRKKIYHIYQYIYISYISYIYIKYIKEIYHIFQELVKTVNRRRKLSDNDMLRLIIQNEELPNAISTKFNKVGNFKLGDLENVINKLSFKALRYLLVREDCT